MIESITSNPVFLFIGTIASIIGVFLGVLAIIPKTRKIFFSHKQSINIDKQEIKGNNNEQSGGNISNSNSSIVRDKQKSIITIGSQKILGNNNKQAGGDINV